MPIPYIQMLIGVTVGVLGFFLFSQIQNTSHNERAHRSGHQYHPPPRHDEPPRRGSPPPYEGKPGDPCVICLENIREENMRKLSCGHVFHKKCFEQIRKCSNNCPICRKVML